MYALSASSSLDQENNYRLHEDFCAPLTLLEYCWKSSSKLLSLSGRLAYLNGSWTVLGQKSEWERVIWDNPCFNMPFKPDKLVRIVQISIIKRVSFCSIENKDIYKKSERLRLLLLRYLDSWPIQRESVTYKRLYLIGWLGIDANKGGNIFYLRTCSPARCL